MTSTSEELRDRALTLLRRTRADRIRDVKVAALRIVIRDGTVNADDVRAVVEIPPGVGPKFVGCAFRDLADSGAIRRTGYAPSKRPVAHARILAEWGLGVGPVAVALLAEQRRPADRTLFDGAN